MGGVSSPGRGEGGEGGKDALGELVDAERVRVCSLAVELFLGDGEGRGQLRGGGRGAGARRTLGMPTVVSAPPAASMSTFLPLVAPVGTFLPFAIVQRRFAQVKPPSAAVQISDSFFRDFEMHYFSGAGGRNTS